MKKQGERKRSVVDPEKKEKKECHAIPPAPPSSPVDGIVGPSNATSGQLAVAVFPPLSPAANASNLGGPHGVKGQRSLSKENVAAAVTGEPTPPLRPLVRQGSVAGKRLSRAPSCVLPISLRNSAWNLADGGGALRSRRADSTVSQCGTTALKQFASSRRPSQRQEWLQADDEETSSTSTAAPTPRFRAVSGGVVQKLLTASGLGVSKSTAIANTSAMGQTHLGRETMVFSRQTSSYGQGYFLPDASARESRSVAKLILIVAVAMVFAVFLCLLLVKVYVMSGTAVKNQCTTQSCASYSSLLLYTINKSVDPCHSFTRFVCDGWTQKQPLSVGETHFVDVLDRLRESTLSADIPVSGQNEEQRALALFLSCDDVRQGKSDQLPLVKEALHRAGITWPERAGSVDLAYTLLYCSLMLGWGTVLDFVVDPYDNGHVLVAKAGSSLPFVIAKTRGFKGSVAKFTYFHALALAFHTRSYGERGGTVGYDNTTAVEVEALEKLAAHYSAYVVRDGEASSVRDIVASTSAPVHEDRWADSLARVKPQYFGTVNITTTVPDYMADVLQLWSDMGEDRLHLFVSWCTVQVAALYANQELIESYYDKSSRKARAQHGAFCLSRAMSLSGPKAVFLNQYVRKLPHADDYAYARTVTSSVREAFHHRLSSWTYYNPNVTVVPDWKYLTSAFRYFDTVSSDPTVAPPDTLPDMSTDSFVHNWHKVAQSVMGTAGLAAALLYSVTRHRYYLASADDGDFELLPYALSFPLFQADLTDALNYGGLGAVVSQALGGILMKAYAAYPESEGPINAVLECLRQDPYSQSPSDDVGVVFGPEAFAVGALVEAYRNVTAPDRSLAGMEEYSAMQLFFIALCYNKCEGMSTGSWESLCNVPLRHLPAFAEAFQCKLYTPMNPFLRCNFI